MNSVLPTKRILTRSEAMALLGKQLFLDALAAGWIWERCAKPGKTDRKRARVFFAAEDVARVEDRILSGEYPPA